MGKNSVDYDVIVIGAGIAGPRVAEILAHKGHRVILIEKDSEPGNPVHCTGIVSVECFDHYKLPRDIILNSISSFVLVSPRGRRLTMKRSNIQAHVLDRRQLDRILVDRAVAAGAHLLTSTRIDDIKWDGSGVTLTGVNNSHPLRLTGRLAVVATGFGAPLARKLWPIPLSNVLSGYQVVAQNRDVKDVEIFTGRSLGKGGFGWVLPWKPGYVLAGVLTRKNTAHLVNDHVERLSKQGKIGEVTEQFRCRALPVGSSATSVKDGIIGVGDAIGQVKATSGGGIFYALMGADIAAGAVDYGLSSGDVKSGTLSAYETAWRARLEGEISQGMFLRNLLEQLPDWVVENLHRLLGAPGMRSAFNSLSPTFDWHSKPLTRMLKLLQRGQVGNPLGSE